MDLDPGAGVPPPKTLAEFYGKGGGPVGLGADKSNFLVQNGTLILAAVVSIILLIALFVMQIGALTRNRTQNISKHIDQIETVSY